MIEYLERIVIYENPKPHVRSRHGYFPAVVNLPSGELLVLFALGEAFESADTMTWVSRSSDRGATWQLQGPLYGKPAGRSTSDYLKADLLSDGSLVAVGYRFHRDDPEQGIGVAETGGVLPGDNIVSVSRDRGRTWSAPQLISRSRPELLEISGPALQSYITKHVPPNEQGAVQGVYAGLASLAAVGLLQVQRDALLVAVEQGEEPSARSEQLARVVASDGFNLDHFGAEVGQHHAASRSHHHVGELDDPDAGVGQCAWVHRHLQPVGSRITRP